MRAVLICFGILIAFGFLILSPRSGPVYVLTGERAGRFSSVQHIRLARQDLKRWATSADFVDGYCFRGAGADDIANVDGVWYAVNGIAIESISHSYIDLDGVKHDIISENVSDNNLRLFLWDINDKINEVCP